MLLLHRCQIALGEYSLILEMYHYILRGSLIREVYNVPMTQGTIIDFLVEYLPLPEQVCTQEPQDFAVCVCLFGCRVLTFLLM